MAKKSETNPASAKTDTDKTSDAAPHTEEPTRTTEPDVSRRPRAAQDSTATQIPNQHNSLLLPGLLVVGVFLAVAVSFGVQYFYYTTTSATVNTATPNTATLESATQKSATPNTTAPNSATSNFTTTKSATPNTTAPNSATSESPSEAGLKRLILDHWIPAVTPTYLRNIQKNEFILNFANLSKSGLGEFGFKLTKGGQVVHLDQLDYFEYLLPSPQVGGKMILRHSTLDLMFNWVVGVGGSDLFITLTSHFGKEPDGNQHVGVFMDDKGDSEQVNFINKATFFFQHPREKSMAGIASEHLLGLVVRRDNTWKEEFESRFGLNEQNMPKEYQTLGSTALCLVKACLQQMNGVEVQTSKGKLFFDEKIHFLKSIPNNLISLDEQVFPLITLARLERGEPLLILNSWMNLIDGVDAEMANRIDGNVILMEKAQAPMLFQLIKEMLPNKFFAHNMKSLEIGLEKVAQATWKHSVGEKGLKDVKWLGHSRGIWQLEQATPSNTSSFELLCLLEDMARVMVDFGTFIGNKKTDLWAQRAKQAEEARKSYWDENEKKYGNLVDGKIVPGHHSHTPLILGLPNQNSPVLTQLVKNLENDPLYCNVGLQLSEEYGAPVSTNYLLLQSFKRYSALSGPSQEATHRLYSRLKNSLIATITQNYRRDKSFYGRFDKNLKALGSKGSLDGTLILPIMTELTAPY